MCLLGRSRSAGKAGQRFTLTRTKGMPLQLLERSLKNRFRWEWLEKKVSFEMEYHLGDCLKKIDAPGQVRMMSLLHPSMTNATEMLLLPADNLDILNFLSLSLSGHSVTVIVSGNCHCHCVRSLSLGQVTLSPSLCQASLLLSLCQATVTVSTQFPYLYD